MSWKTLLKKAVKKAAPKVIRYLEKKAAKKLGQPKPSENDAR